MTQPMTQPIAQPIAQPMTQPIAQPVPQPIAQPVPQPVPFIASPSYVSVASIPLYTPQQSFTYGMVQDNSVYGSLVTGMNEGTLYSQPDTVRDLNGFDIRIRCYSISQPIHKEKRVEVYRSYRVWASKR